MIAYSIDKKYTIILPVYLYEDGFKDEGSCYYVGLFRNLGSESIEL